MKKKILLMLTMLVMAFSFGTSIEAQAKTTTITVKSANTATAKKLDKQLKKGKKFTVKVKGSKKSSKKLLDKTNKKIQKVNKYSVKMNTQRGKTKKGYTYYTVSADNAKLYKYTIALLDDMYTKCSLQAIYTTEEIVKANDFEETGNWEKRRVEHIDNFTYKDKWKKDFCDLTTMQQARVITATIHYNDGVDERNGAYIHYGFPEDIQVNQNCYTKSQLMRRLVTKTASGTCGDIALYQMLIFNQVSIPSYFNESANNNHAVVAFKVTNSAGKTAWLSADSGEWDCVWFVGDWTLRNASKKVINEAKTNQFTKYDDVKEVFIEGGVTDGISAYHFK